MKRICVFCGSNPGVRPEYTQAARSLGRALAATNTGLVYGGARVGMMGQLADAALEAEGEVIGVIPEALANKELAHPQLTDLRVVASMHQRKALMAELADGFIALPGGFGTFEEFLEVLTWSQLGMHRKPCGLLNVSGYYKKLLAFFDHAVSQSFVRAEHRSMILVDESPEKLLRKLTQYRHVAASKWSDRSVQ